MADFVSMVRDLKNSYIKRVEDAGYGCFEDVNDADVCLGVQLPNLDEFLRFVDRELLNSIFYQVNARDVSDFLVTSEAWQQGHTMAEHKAGHAISCDCYFDSIDYNHVVTDLFRRCPGSLTFFVYVDGLVVGTQVDILENEEHKYFLHGDELAYNRACESAGLESDMVQKQSCLSQVESFLDDVIELGRQAEKALDGDLDGES